MKKTLSKILLLVLTLSFAVSCFTACGGGDDDNKPEFIDYVSQLTLDMNSTTKKQEVTVNAYIDGDTTHFKVPRDEQFDTGVLKARYLAINTPESTGKIEDYGKAASRFTKETLKKATSIIIESDTEKWNADSTGGRYLVWVWYRTGNNQPYRNLNLEILQNGLAAGSSTSENNYGDICTKALQQAVDHKLLVFSGVADPEKYTGDAVEVTLKELRSNIEDYAGIDVVFEGVVTINNDGTCYVEEYDEESNMCHGIQVFYGYDLSGTGLEILTVGNRVKIVGNVQYWENSKTYQISDLKYNLRKPDDPRNIQKISEGNEIKWTLTDAKTFADGKIVLEKEEEIVTYNYCDLALHTTIKMEGLKIVDSYTTKNGDSQGAMTWTCKAADGTEIQVRTEVFKDEDGNIITEDAYLGKTVNVVGLVEYYFYNEVGTYQIKVFSPARVTIVE